MSAQSFKVRRGRGYGKAAEHLIWAGERLGRRREQIQSSLFEEAARHGLTPPEMEAITTADWPTPARRPPDSRLDCGKLAATFGVRLPHWRDSLGKTVDAIFAAERACA